MKEGNFILWYIFWCKLSTHDKFVCIWGGKWTKICCYIRFCPQLVECPCKPVSTYDKFYCILFHHKNVWVLTKRSYWWIDGMLGCAPPRSFFSFSRLVPHLCGWSHLWEILDPPLVQSQFDKVKFEYTYDHDHETLSYIHATFWVPKWATATLWLNLESDVKAHVRRTWEFLKSRTAGWWMWSHLTSSPKLGSYISQREESKSSQVSNHLGNEIKYSLIQP